jgi:phosphatidate phosphatase APP1
MQTTKSGPAGNLIIAHKPGFIEKLWRWFGFTHRPSIKLYMGYGHAEQLVIYGHALAFAPLPQKKYSKFFLVNLVALFRMFILRTIKGSVIRLHWENKEVVTKSDTDGFIRLSWQSETPPAYGWHEITAEMLNSEGEIIAEACAPVMIPHSTQYAFISDIDDTFLISHSSNLRKRLSLLFTHNARTRKPFEDVVRHYQLLALAQTSAEQPNPFFYVSSSEWNLYDYIMEFVTVNGLPKGVLLLNTIKHLSDFLSTGQSGHGTKFTRIVRVLEAFPKQKFVLLGDSSQQDPVIYQSIVSHFPGRIHAVYIRDIRRRNSARVRLVLRQLETSGTPCCFFRHSSEAIEHSRMIGLITP